MVEAATQPGVVSDRMEMYAEIERKSQERVEKELKDSGFEGTLLGADEVVSDGRPDSIPEEDWAAMSDEAKGTARKAAEPPADPEAPAVAAEPEKPAETVKTVKIKVDGRELDVPESEIIEAGIRAKQKDSTADKRLEEATRLLREAEARTRSEPLGQPSKDAGHVAPQSEEDARALAHAIQYGSEDEAAAAIQKLRNKEAAPGLSPEQIAFIVDERTQFSAGVNWYRTEAKDIAEDRNLHVLFLAKEKEARAAGDKRPYRELYESLVKDMRDWLGTKAPSPKDPLETKRERKAAAPANPTPASVRQPAPQPEKVPTPSETIEEMRRARHQA